MLVVLLPQAVYQKAEILFLTGNYQLSSVYYKRGQKLDPDSPRFQQGIQRSTQALQKFGGGEYTRQLSFQQGIQRSIEAWQKLGGGEYPLSTRYTAPTEAL